MMAKRQLATMPAARLSTEAKVTSLPSGLTLATAPSNSSLAGVGIVVKAGPRNETYENAGVSHALRAAVGCSTKNFTGFSIQKNIQQTGADFQVIQGREYTLYAAQGHYSTIDGVIDYLLEVVSAPAFKPWELSETIGLIRNQLADRPAAEIAIELLHKAAFREGLGNSLYTPEYMVGAHKPAVLQGFFNKTYTAQRSTMVGIGIEHAQLAKYANMLNMESGQGPSDKTAYYGGDERVDTTGKKAVVAIAAPIAGSANPKDALVAKVLARALGRGQPVKRSAGNGPIAKALAEIEGASASGLVRMYSDAGLLGVQIDADASQAGRAVEAVAAVLRNVNLKPEEIEGAKKAVLIEESELLQSPRYVMNSLGCGGNPSQTLSALQTVTTGDVQALAKKISSGKLSIGAVGNLSTVPYSDSL